MKLSTLALLVIFLAASPARSEDPPEVLVQKAQEAHRAGDMATAIRLYREFLKDHPEVAEIRSNLGAALARDGQFEAAIQEYREALKKLPSPGIRLNLALAYYKLGRLPQAAAESNPFIRCSPMRCSRSTCWATAGCRWASPSK